MLIINRANVVTRLTKIKSKLSVFSKNIHLEISGIKLYGFKPTKI